jgi:transposase
MEFMREFPNDAACLEYLWRSRYASDGEHADCPKCKHERPFRKYATAQGRQSWTCTSCGHHVHPTAGTIFEKSSTSLHLWFYAMYLVTSTRCGEGVPVGGPGSMRGLVGLVCSLSLSPRIRWA